ncbi:MAG TPA: MTH1187 family thiamine-binding protein [Caldithrix abyssi]|uniref:MTH1187 family thiamine-binding protein n=1 Tax=Caldithrix abyssi TaxID=187145 RepID=A0A7V5PP78_CALAY|nr:MTH1187 family thiamine-binding protein [Caldithrix abyssi]
MVLLEFSMSPLDKGESLAPYVARVLDIVDRSGVPYRLNPMGTVLEGDYDRVMQVVRDCFMELKKDCRRISVSVKIDYREGDDYRMDAKIEKVEKLLKREVKK